MVADKIKVGGLPVMALLSLAAGIALFTFLENRFPQIQRIVRGPTG